MEPSKYSLGCFKDANYHGLFHLLVGKSQEEHGGIQMLFRMGWRFLDVLMEQLEAPRDDYRLLHGVAWKIPEKDGSSHRCLWNRI